MTNPVGNPYNLHLINAITTNELPQQIILDDVNDDFPSLNHLDTANQFQEFYPTLSVAGLNFTNLGSRLLGYNPITNIFNRNNLSSILNRITSCNLEILSQISPQLKQDVVFLIAILRKVKNSTVLEYFDHSIQTSESMLKVLSSFESDTSLYLDLLYAATKKEGNSNLLNHPKVIANLQRSATRQWILENLHKKEKPFLLEFALTSLSVNDTNLNLSSDKKDNFLLKLLIKARNPKLYLLFSKETRIDEKSSNTILWLVSNAEPAVYFFLMKEITQDKIRLGLSGSAYKLYQRQKSLSLNTAWLLRHSAKSPVFLSSIKQIMYPDLLKDVKFIKFLFYRTRNYRTLFLYSACQNYMYFEKLIYDIYEERPDLAIRALTKIIPNLTQFQSSSQFNKYENALKNLLQLLRDDPTTVLNKVLQGGNLELLYELKDLKEDPDFFYALLKSNSFNNQHERYLNYLGKKLKNNPDFIGKCVDILVQKGRKHHLIYILKNCISEELKQNVAFKELILSKLFDLKQPIHVLLYIQTLMQLEQNFPPADQSHWELISSLPGPLKNNPQFCVSLFKFLKDLELLKYISQDVRKNPDFALTILNYLTDWIENHSNRVFNAWYRNQNVSRVEIYRHPNHYNTHILPTSKDDFFNSMHIGAFIHEDLKNNGSFMIKACLESCKDPSLLEFCSKELKNNPVFRQAVHDTIQKILPNLSLYVRGFKDWFELANTALDS